MQIPLIAKLCAVFFACCYIFICHIFIAQAAQGPDWSESELVLLRMQWLGSMPELPPDPTNKYCDNPEAAELGRKLFFDTRFSANGKVSCATCHVPELLFTDGLARARGIGETARSAPGIIGVAYSPWYFWDGRSDSQWSQALGPLESGVEHGGNRSQYAQIIYSDPDYREMYQAVFGDMPDISDTRRFPANAAPLNDKESDAKWHQMSEQDRRTITRIFVNLGKAIAAYERLLMPAPSRFDQYVEAELQGTPTGTNFMTVDEVAGLKLFIGKAMCVSCHQGPLFTNHGFHNVGAPDPATTKPKYTIPLLYVLSEKPPVDMGRYKGIQQALKSEFNCLNEYSDADDRDCAELKFANTKHTATMGAFKVPSLRNVSKTAPYMHAGQFNTLAEVLNHYNSAPKAHIGHNELLPLGLTETELQQLEAFLHSLDSPPDVAAELLRAR